MPITTKLIGTAFKLGFLLGTTSLLQGFVLLSGPTEAKLDVTSDTPDVTFVLGSEHPPFEKKEDYQDGLYENSTDDELWPILVQDAMSRWNRVPSAFINLRVDTTNSASAAFDQSDLVNSIVVGSMDFSSAALANPEVSNAKIIDCDIQVGSRSVEVNDLLYTLTHELGHCLGLGHNHSNYGAIMGYSRDDRTARLGGDDIAGVTYLYPHPTLADGKARELISCGNIDASKHGATPVQRRLLILMMLFPLIFANLRLPVLKKIFR